MQYSCRCCHCVRHAHLHAAHLSLAWLPTRLSSATRQQRSSLWFEGGSPQHSKLYATLLILRRAVLFRQSRILPWRLQRRQFWPVLDLDAHRADLELWVDASGPSDPRRLLWQWVFRASCLCLPLARAYLLSQLGYLLAQFIDGGKIGGALVVFGLQLGAQFRRTGRYWLRSPNPRTSRVGGKRCFGPCG
jgi:hypothetical protein